MGIVKKMSLISKILFKRFLRMFKGELQCQNKLISSERPFKILQDETKIIKIGHAIFEIFNFIKIEIWTILREKTTEKPKVLFFGSFAKTEEQ